MDHTGDNLEQLSLSTRIIIENREHEIRWTKAAREDDIVQVGQYVLNEILKQYQTDTVILKDHEHQEYGLKDIIAFQIREIYVFIPHHKEVKTFINSELREVRSVIGFFNVDKIKVEKYKNKTTKQESVYLTLSIIKKQNSGFEKILGQLVESRLNNLQVSSNTPKLFFVSDAISSQPDDSDGQQLSPKFGAPSAPVQVNMLNSKTGSAGDADLKKREKVPTTGTQHDYLKNQANQAAHEMKGYTMAEIAQHRTDTDAWTVINGKVYDVTQYLNYHPGGKDKLMMGVGRDGTELFNKYHPWVNAHYILMKNHIGFVVHK